MEIVNRSTCKMGEKNGSMMTPRMFSKFVQNPTLFNPSGGLDLPRPVADKLSVMARVLLFYGDEGLRSRFVFAEPPINPTTKKPFGVESKKYQEWADSLGVPPERVASDEDLAQARHVAALVKKCPAWPPGSIDLSDDQGQPLPVPVSLMHQDAAVKSEYKGLPLLGYCDWILQVDLGGGNNFLIPAYMVVVNDINNPSNELSARRKHWEALFTMFCLNPGVEIKDKFLPAFIIVETNPKPRIGVIFAIPRLGNNVPVSSSVVTEYIDDYLEQRDSGVWKTRFEEPKYFNLNMYQ